MLYTVMPPELVLEEPEDCQARVFEVETRGVRLVLASPYPGQWVVERLISTNPNDYLKEEFQPGTQFPLDINFR